MAARVSGRHPGFARGQTRALGLALGTLLGGCADDDRYALVTSWAVNAQAPSAEVCAREGVAQVRLTLQDGARMRTIESDCTRSLELRDGYRYGGFVTTRALAFDVTYRYRVELLRRDGSAVLDHTGSVFAHRGDVTPVELPTVEVFDPLGDAAPVVGSFSVGAGDPAELCAKASVNRVELWVYSALEDTTSPDTPPVHALYGDCASGELVSNGPLLALGDYQITYVALDYQSEAHYSVVDESAAIPVSVDAPRTVTLPKVELSF
jgi:hypothetical protein